MRLGNLDGRLVLVSPDGAVDVETISGGRFTSDPRAIFQRYEEFRDWAASTGPSAAEPYDPARLGPPVPDPRQIFAIGLNYRDHVTESGLTEPSVPAVFTKFPTCLTGPHDAVVLPPGAVDFVKDTTEVVAPVDVQPGELVRVGDRPCRGRRQAAVAAT
jgi:2-keto-4-pentenoate hydratase/2-oxohepta-3-ene-1,7-dioic acid hydratase in catechol pathway